MWVVLKYTVRRLTAALTLSSALVIPTPVALASDIEPSCLQGAAKALSEIYSKVNLRWSGMTSNGTRVVWEITDLNDLKRERLAQDFKAFHEHHGDCLKQWASEVRNIVMAGNASKDAPKALQEILRSGFISLRSLPAYSPLIVDFVDNTTIPNGGIGQQLPDVPARVLGSTEKSIAGSQKDGGLSITAPPPSSEREGDRSKGGERDLFDWLFGVGVVGQLLLLGFMFLVLRTLRGDKDRRNIVSYLREIVEAEKGIRFSLEEFIKLQKGANEWLSAGARSQPAAHETLRGRDRPIVTSQENAQPSKRARREPEQPTETREAPISQSVQDLLSDYHNILNKVGAVEHFEKRWKAIGLKRGSEQGLDRGVDLVREANFKEADFWAVPVPTPPSTWCVLPGRRHYTEISGLIADGGSLAKTRFSGLFAIAGNSKYELTKLAYAYSSDREHFQIERQGRLLLPGLSHY